MGAALSRTHLEGPVVEVAPLLLGVLLAHAVPGQGRVVVRLTEVEAYAGEDDPGSHAFRGPTPRTTVMFGPPGRAYVYLSYGMHWCLNVVTGVEGSASAVLLRAGEVVDGVDLARSRRPSARTAHDLARGPARLTAALGIGRGAYGVDLCRPGGALRLLPGAGPMTSGPLTSGPVTSGRVTSGPVSAGPRVGVSGPGGAGGEFPWRFWLTGEPTVSAYRPATSRGRAR